MKLALGLREWQHRQVHDRGSIQEGTTLQGMNIQDRTDLGDTTTGDYHSNMAGVITLLSNFMSCEWIIDSGASSYHTS